MLTVAALKESALSTLEHAAVVPEPVAFGRSELLRREALGKLSEPQCASIVPVNYSRLLTF